MKNNLIALILIVVGVILGALLYKECWAPVVGKETHDTLVVERWHDAKASPPETLWFASDTVYVPDTSGLWAIKNRDSLLFWMMSPWGSKKDTTLTVKPSNDTSLVLLGIHLDLQSLPRQKKNELTFKADSIRIPEKIIINTKIVQETDWQKTAIGGILIAGVIEGIKILIGKR